MNEKTIIVKQDSVGSFMRGIVLGAAVALLFAPRSGRDTRQIIMDMVSEKGSDFKDKAFDAAKNTRDRAQTMVADARDKFGAKVKTVSENMNQAEGKSRSQLERELAIDEDIENPEYPL